MLHYCASLFFVANNTIPQTGKVIKKWVYFDSWFWSKVKGQHLAGRLLRQWRTSHGEKQGLDEKPNPTDLYGRRT
jgi:hypothetical protein